MKSIYKLSIIILLLTSLLLTSCGSAPQTPQQPEDDNAVQQYEKPQTVPEQENQEVSDPEQQKEKQPESSPVLPEQSSSQEGPSAAEPENPPAEPVEPPAPAEPEHKRHFGESKTDEKHPDDFEGYFADSLFIGDSRTVGLVEYGHLGIVTAFCNTGLSVYNYDNDDLVVNGFGKISLSNLLELGSFDKIYIGLGINELGYEREDTVQHFVSLIDLIKANQPNATMYILANLRVTASRSRRDKTHNNANIDSLNERLKELCDGTKLIYIDGNPVFDDGAGNLSTDYTGDNTHLYARCYPDWAKFIYDNSF